ncbi:DUF998 domain-containing protein [Arcanobacterium phocisimile]|uniref:DUF998 domain-containing protein n=1 Tax=Arcanobacterium phocisimile TaxID=1302235 RepID=A0ABX7IGC4_9ACTO|nr:DUF998 domain-containing protein [Arcanobacterium phocisimile]QRV01514.1 DUF998 domain-containing protein [Arcanobacterium phocisimile]
MYASFLLEIFYQFPLNPRVSYLSEYFSIDSPYRIVFATSDLLSAALTLAGLACLGDYYRYWTRWQLLIAFSYVVFSVFTVLDVSLPLKCAESLDFCAKTGLTPHMVASAFVSASLIAISIGTIALITQGKIRGGMCRALLAIVLLYLALTALIAYLDLMNMPVGYAQRAHVFFSCALLASAGLLLSPYEYSLPWSRTRA